MTAPLLSLLDRFRSTRVVVLADLVLDEFQHTEISRVSREAPVLIVEDRRTDAMPGGGANAVANLKALGGDPVPVGVVGDDEPGHRLVALLGSAGVDTSAVSTLPGYATPVKTRVLAGLPHSRQQQVIRIDRGAAGSVPAAAAEAAAARAAALLREASSRGLLISDYGFGAATPGSSGGLVRQAAAGRIPSTCDSRHRLAGFTGVTASTPNLEEAEAILGSPLDAAGADPAQAGRRLLAALGSRAVLVTRGSRGMTLVEEGASPEEIPVYGGDEVADVTGAGDTVIAAFTLALAAGAPFRLAAILANVAAGLVVMKQGTATVRPEEIREAIARRPPDQAAR